MEMKLDSVLLRSERQKRAWSQEHLAEVSGLGLRTIQRIEKNGVASYESVRALAAVFSITIEDLVLPPENDQHRGSMRPAIAGFSVAVLAAVTVAIFSNSSQAEQVMLDVGVSQNGLGMTEGHLLTAEGKEAEMRINDTLRVVIVPTIRGDGKVLLVVNIYEIVGEEFVLLLQPKLITANNKEAEIRVDGESGNSFRVLLTPHTGG